MKDASNELRKFEFFQLPAEVRLAIYKHLLPPSVLLSWDLCAHLADLWESNSADLNLQNFWDTHHESPRTAVRNMDTFVRRRPLSVEYAWPWDGHDPTEAHHRSDRNDNPSSPQVATLLNLTLTSKTACHELLSELFANLHVQATTPIELHQYSLRLPAYATQQIRKLTILTLCQACTHNRELDLVVGRCHAQWLPTALRAFPSLTCLTFRHVEIRKAAGMGEIKWRPKDLYALSEVAEMHPRLKAASFTYGAAQPTAVVLFAGERVDGWEGIDFGDAWRAFLDQEVMKIDGEDLMALFEEGIEKSPVSCRTCETSA